MKAVVVEERKRKREAKQQKLEKIRKKKAKREAEKLKFELL